MYIFGIFKGGGLPAAGGAAATGHAAAEGAAAESASSAAAESSSADDYRGDYLLGDGVGFLVAPAAVEAYVFLDAAPLAAGGGRQNRAAIYEGACPRMAGGALRIVFLGVHIGDDVGLAAVGAEPYVVVYGVETFLGVLAGRQIGVVVVLVDAQHARVAVGAESLVEAYVALECKHKEIGGEEAAEREERGHEQPQTSILECSVGP